MVKHITVLVALALAGCAVIKVNVQRGADVYNGIGISCFKDIHVYPMTFGADGAVRSEGYQSGVDGESLGIAAGTAGKVLVKP